MENGRTDILEGVVEQIIFHNPENGYTVFMVTAADSLGNEEEIPCTANMPDLNIGEAVKLTGCYVMHHSYGRQFNVAVLERSLPTSLSGIERYLGSGVIKGVGKALAKRIVSHFGENTLSVLENNPEKLSRVQGISKDKAITIGNIYREQWEVRNIMMYLQGFGISMLMAQKIYKKYKDKTIDVVKANPYALADDISGLGFRTVDQMAAQAGIDKNSQFRIKSGVKYLLTAATGDGHVYLPKAELVEKAVGLMDVSQEEIENAILKMQFENIIWQKKLDDEVVVYLNMFYSAEVYAAKRLLELTDFPVRKVMDIDKDIAKAEKQEGIFLAEKQKEAVRQAFQNGVLVITGGPGTGKTTAINTIIHIMEKEELTIQLAAPTGRAAKRMTEATGMEAMTIHRMLNVTMSDGDNARMIFEKDEDDPVDADVVIIDESSMVDILLMYHLAKALKPGTRLILVGDVDQLPSVGPGNVLRDIISSGEVKVVRLTEIFRQAQESAIVMNAHRINKGEYPVLNERGSDFFFMKRLNAQHVGEAVLELVTKRLPLHYKVNPIMDIQVLAPMRKGYLGVGSLNVALQKTLNPPSSGKKEKELRGVVFREGDKVMQTKNNYNMMWRQYDSRGKLTAEGSGIFNGDEGFIKEIDEAAQIIKVIFDGDRHVHYDYTQLDELDLSYAVTIHKSQGSEYRTVVMPIHSGPPMLMSRNLLYTAVTRARKLCVIVGVPETLHAMVDNANEVKRYSSLDFRIKRMREFMGGQGDGIHHKNGE